MLNKPSPAATASAYHRLLVELANPKTAALSDRQLGRRWGLHRLVVRGVRGALHEAPLLNLRWECASEEERLALINKVGLRRLFQFALCVQCVALIRQLIDASRPQPFRRFQQSLLMIRQRFLRTKRGIGGEVMNGGR
jgi:hypothetical protein